MSICIDCLDKGYDMCLCPRKKVSNGTTSELLTTTESSSNRKVLKRWSLARNQNVAYMNRLFKTGRIENLEDVPVSIINTERLLELLKMEKISSQREEIFKRSPKLRHLYSIEKANFEYWDEISGKEDGK